MGTIVGKMRAAIAAVLVGSAASCVYLDDNFRAVEPGEFYRSGQMADHRLGRFVNSHGIQTVVNLRGASPGQTWYDEELAVCEGLDVAHFDLDWTMKRLPSPESLAQLVQVYDNADGPILVHCHGGTHRAAIASAVYRLLRGDSIDEARGEIGVFFDDAPIGRLLDLYEKDGGDFRTWATKRYPGIYAAQE